MSRKRKDSFFVPEGGDTPMELDFLAEVARQTEIRELERITEGITLHEPSSIGDIEEAAWIKLQGATPLEFLRMVYVNPWNDMKDRVSAARSILDFCHKKLPQKIEMDGNMVQTRKITAENLGKLSDAELETFTKLLEKLG